MVHSSLNPPLMNGTLSTKPKWINTKVELLPPNSSFLTPTSHLLPLYPSVLPPTFLLILPPFSSYLLTPPTSLPLYPTSYLLPPYSSYLPTSPTSLLLPLYFPLPPPTSLLLPLPTASLLQPHILQPHLLSLLTSSALLIPSYYSSPLITHPLHNPSILHLPFLLLPPPYASLLTSPLLGLGLSGKFYWRWDIISLLWLILVN